MSVTAITETIIAEIEEAVAGGSRVAPAPFSACYPRANVSAAFRIALERGLIVVDAVSLAGTPIYRKALRLSKGGS